MTDQDLTLRVARAMGLRDAYLHPGFEGSDVWTEPTVYYRSEHGDWVSFLPLAATADGAAVLEALLRKTDLLPLSEGDSGRTAFVTLGGMYGDDPDLYRDGPTIWHAAARALCAVVEGE